MPADDRFEQLIEEADRQPFAGWDFSYLRGRLHEGATSWDYSALARRRLASATSVLDLGTGGGEFLASLAPLPPHAAATEAYRPNVEIARVRLAPLGVEVVAVAGAPDNVEIEPGAGLGTLPFADESFALILSRHESYYPAEVHRILARGGHFLTQQVGETHNQRLNELLGVPARTGPVWDLAFAARQLEEAGFDIVGRREEYPMTVFSDIGAVVYYLKAIPWEVPGFTAAAYREQLAALHQRMQAEGGLRMRGHLFYLEAIRSSACQRERRCEPPLLATSIWVCDDPPRGGRSLTRFAPIPCGRTPYAGTGAACMGTPAGGRGGNTFVWAEEIA